MSVGAARLHDIFLGCLNCFLQGDCRSKGSPFATVGPIEVFPQRTMQHMLQKLAACWRVASKKKK